MKTSPNKRKVLYMDDKLPFGKYKGQTLADVLYDDSSYARWLDEHVDYYQFEWDINTKWCEIIDKNDTAPKDGLYLIACICDLPIYIEMVKLSQGDRFWDKYDEENKKEHWYDIDCLAYRYIEEFSEQSPEWIKTIELIENKFGCWVFCISPDKIGSLQYVLVQDVPLLEIEKYKDSIKGYHYTPPYTPSMMINHREMLKSKKIMNIYDEYR